MNMPLSLCESRDAKGLYKLARAGKIKGTKIKYIFYATGYCNTLTWILLSNYAYFLSSHIEDG